MHLVIYIYIYILAYIYFKLFRVVACKKNSARWITCMQTANPHLFMSCMEGHGFLLYIMLGAKYGFGSSADLLRKPRIVGLHSKSEDRARKAQIRTIRGFCCANLGFLAVLDRLFSTRSNSACTMIIQACG